MSGKRSRKAGHGYEVEVTKALRKAGFPHAVTARSANRLRDAQKIDIVNADEYTQGRLPYNIQCKNIVQSSRTFNYHKTLEELPVIEGITNVVLRKLTVKSESGKFIAKAKYAFMHQHDFMTMVAELNKLKAQLSVAINFCPEKELDKLISKLAVYESDN